MSPEESVGCRESARKEHRVAGSASRATVTLSVCFWRVDEDEGSLQRLKKAFSEVVVVARERI